VRVPVIRQQLKKYRNDINVQLAIELLHSEWHEIRLFAALSLLDQFQRAKQDSLRKTIVTQYLAHRQYVNNWDIVDGSAPGICGGWYYDRDRSRLHRLIRARSLWDRRIAMMSTLFFIRKHDFADTYHFAEQLLHDKEDLIHKASGWMLREAGKRDSKLLSEFLNRHAAAMPRTMLRNAGVAARQPAPATVAPVDRKTLSACARTVCEPRPV